MNFFPLRRKSSLFARYSLKFSRCSFLVVKSIVDRSKICSLLVAEVALCKKSLVTHCKVRLLLVAEVVRWKKSLVMPKYQLGGVRKMNKLADWSSYSEVNLVLL